MTLHYQMSTSIVSIFCQNEKLDRFRVPNLFEILHASKTHKTIRLNSFGALKGKMLIHQIKL